MKKSMFVFALFSLISFQFVSAQTEQPVQQPAVEEPTSIIRFDQMTYDFGSIEQGKPVTGNFVFYNDSKVPLVISDVRKSCGCTNVSFPKEPVMPGKSGTVSATYNAAAMGNFMKSVTVMANTKEKAHVLYIKGQVLQQNP
jgi:hypothetical protein